MLENRALAVKQGNEVKYPHQQHYLREAELNRAIKGEDGTRDKVIKGYKEYFKYKKSLHPRLKELKGKA